MYKFEKHRRPFLKFGSM